MSGKELVVGISLELFNYTLNNEAEAWNLPSIKSAITADYAIDNWFAGAELFLNGKTKDLEIPYGTIAKNGILVKNDAFADVNLKGGYIFSNRLTAFAKINNALGKKYHRFLNYPVQPLQLLAGLTYKFDL